MEKFYQYIENALPNKGNSKTLYKFKKETLDSMFARANELTSRGLTDDNVLTDIIISEYGDIVEDYKKYEAEKKKKAFRRRFLIGNIIGSFAYILTLLIVFLGVSFATHDWGHTWVIMVDGILIWVAYLLSIIIHRVLELKRIFHFIARILLAIDVMVLSVAVFIFCMAILHLELAWLIVFDGLLLMFLCDAIFVSVTKQRLAIINWLAYIPAMSALFYVILGATGAFSWNVGWVMIPLSFVLDLIITFVAIARNNRIKEEVVDEWKES